MAQYLMHGPTCHSLVWSMLEERLLTTLRTHPQVLAHLRETEQAVLRNQMTPTQAVERLLRALGHCHSISDMPVLHKESPHT